MCTVWPSKLSAAIGRSVVRSFGKDRSSNSSAANSNTNTHTPLNNSFILTTTTSTATVTTTNSSSCCSTMSGSGKKEGTRDLATEARSFTSSLANVFLMKKRDQQSKHLLEKAQFFIDALLAENQKLSTTRSGPSTPRQTRSAGGMGQLWVKLDELKRENDVLRRQRGRSQDDRSASSSPKDNKGPGEVIINDLQKTKTDNETLKTQVAQLQKMVRELQAVNAGLQDEYKRSKAALDAAQRSVEKARHDYKKLDLTHASVKAENESLLKQNKSASSTALAGMKPVTVPVAGTRSDNRLTENISDRCRPSTIAVRYDKLESQQWVDAKEALEDAPGCDLEEGQIVTTLCQGLMSTFSASRQLYANVELVIGELLRRPTLATEVVDSQLVSACETAPLTDDLGDLIKQKLRQTTDSVNTDIITAMASSHQDRDTSSTLNSFSSNSAVHSFLAESSRTTWQMVVQNPAMALATDDTTFDNLRHKLWWSCDQSRARNVDMFVWPVLLDYENGNILVKGCVCAS